MNTKDRAGSAKNQSKNHQPSVEDEQINPPEIATPSCLQNGGLSSRGSGSPQTGATSATQWHCSALDDVSVQIAPLSMAVTIPDDLIEKAAEDFLKGGHRDSPGPLGPMGYPRNPTANAEDAITNTHFSKVDKK